MKIKTRLSLQFALIVAVIILLFSVSIYFFSEKYRQHEFNSRLKEKAISTARLLIEVKEIDSNLLQIIDRSSMKLVDERIVIYDEKNHKVFINNKKDTIEDEPELLNLIRADKEIKFTRKANECVGILYHGKTKDFVIIASAYDKYGFSKLNVLKVTLIFGFFFSMAITILVSLFYSHQALKPISNIIKQVDKISGSNLDSRLNTGNGKDEIAQLATTFNNMLERVDSTFRVQKSFVSNASHELRTPLTAITGQIEVTLMNQRSSQEYEIILNSILEDIKNLNKLSNGLLELAQASSDITSIPLRNIRIDELFWQSRADILKRKPEYNINIEFKEFPEDEKKLILQGSDSLIKTAITNLMENACKFSLDKSVNIEIGFDGQYILLTFADKGIGIAKDELKHIFEPFFRASNAKSINGHGIGLSLAQKIIQLHSGTIDMDSELNVGTKTFVKLPYLKAQV
jgi:two-component system, OmpR family, sensor histidine kinase ArlS